MEAINTLEQLSCRSRPRLRTGDTVEVHYQVKEADKTRIQLFRGVVIAQNRGGIGATFRVRKVSFGVGVERIFPVHSPLLQEVKVLQHGLVRRAKLYYLRGLEGRAAAVPKVQRNQKAEVETMLIRSKGAGSLHSLVVRELERIRVFVSPKMISYYWPAERLGLNTFLAKIEQALPRSAATSEVRVYVSFDDGSDAEGCFDSVPSERDLNRAVEGRRVNFVRVYTSECDFSLDVADIDDRLVGVLATPAHRNLALKAVLELSATQATSDLTAKERASLASALHKLSG